MSGVFERRPRHRRKKETEPAAPPEPTTSTLWASPDSSGVLVHHTCMWEVRDLREKDRGWPRTDRSPLAAAVAGALDAYDVIVLLPKSGWSYPDRENATAHVVLGEINVFPDADCRTALAGPGREERGVALSPAQSAAVL
ncbi:hypothetical protein ACPCAC_09720 [Streptomyces lavendulocolor]|uniref:hypothetical protein n=1 Tax=Streptomyces lavendulocolor TaxID=67316 RepID=UPI003C2D5D84